MVVDLDLEVLIAQKQSLLLQKTGRIRYIFFDCKGSFAIKILFSNKYINKNDHNRVLLVNMLKKVDPEGLEPSAT